MRPCATAPRGQRFLLGVHHGAQGARQIGLAEDLAGLRSAAVRAGRRACEVGPRSKKRRLRSIAHDAHFVDGQAVGQFDGGLHGFGERLGAVLAQRHQCRFHHAGHQRGHRPATGTMPSVRPSPAATMISSGCSLWSRKKSAVASLGHRADAGDGVDLAVSRADQDRRFAADAEVGELVDRRGEHRGDAGVHGVAAAVVHAHAGFGGGLTAGRHRAVRAARSVPHRTVELPAFVERTQSPKRPQKAPATCVT